MRFTNFSLHRNIPIKMKSLDTLLHYVLNDPRKIPIYYSKIRALEKLWWGFSQSERVYIGHPIIHVKIYAWCVKRLANFVFTIILVNFTLISVNFTIILVNFIIVLINFTMILLEFLSDCRVNSLFERYNYENVENMIIKNVDIN